MAGTRLQIIASFIIPFIIILPFAYDIQRIYRAWIPDNNIKKLIETPLDFRNLSLTVQMIFINTEDTKGSIMGPVMEYETNVIRSDLPSFRVLLRNMTLNNIYYEELVTANDIDDKLLALGKEKVSNFTDSFAIFIFPATALAEKRMTMGKYRHGWMKAREPNFIDETKEILQIFNNDIMVQSQRSSMRVSMSYRLKLDYLIEGPGNRNYINSCWNLEDMLYTNLSPLLRSLSRVAKIAVESEVHYYARLFKESSFKLHDSSNQEIVDALRNFLSSNDHLSFSVLNDTEQIIHLMTFVPTSDLAADFSKRPLSFIIPGWGGVAVDRHPELCANNAEETTASFIHIVRSLFGLSYSLSVVKLQSPKIISQWEEDILRFYFLRSHEESMRKSLESAVRLIESMPHIHVPESVKSHVTNIVSVLMAESADHNVLHVKMDNLIETLPSSRALYTEPSMVPQLYFPPDHIYAVYLPLLCPLFLPLLLGIYRETKRFYKKKEKKSKQKQQ